MGFSFGFSGDDIEEDPNDVQQEQSQTQSDQDANSLAPPIPAKTHDMDTLVSPFLIIFYMHPWAIYIWRKESSFPDEFELEKGERRERICVYVLKIKVSNISNPPWKSYPRYRRKYRIRV